MLTLSSLLTVRKHEDRITRVQKGGGEYLLKSNIIVMSYSTTFGDQVINQLGQEVLIVYAWPVMDSSREVCSIDHC